MENAKNIIFGKMRSLTINMFVLLFIVLVNSCKHDNFEEFVGPGQCPSSAFDFTTNFSAGPNNVNLQTTPVNIVAGFNEPVKWTVTISGTSSGAVRTYSGSSTSVNINWRGEPGLEGTNVKFFTAETVDIKLLIACKDAITTSIVIGTVNNFNDYKTAGAGFLVTDFDGGGSANNTFMNTYNGAGWTAYISPTSTDVLYEARNTPLSSPQGGNYMIFKGKAASNSWYVGGIEALFSLSSITGYTGEAEDMYFNAFIHNGGNSTTLLSISLVEGSFPNSIAYTKNINLNWSGWKLVSIKLSDLTSKRGVNLQNTLALHTVSFGLNPASAQGQSTELNIDGIIFTKGADLLGNK